MNNEFNSTLCDVQYALDNESHILRSGPNGRSLQMRMVSDSYGINWTAMFYVIGVYNDHKEGVAFSNLTDAVKYYTTGILVR